MAEKNAGTFRGLFGFVVSHPRAILTVALILAAFSALYTARSMEFLTGRDDLMPKHSPFQRDYRAFKAEFGDQEEIVVVMEGDDTERVGRFGQELSSQLGRDRAHFRDVFYPNGLPFFQKNGLLFMPLADLRMLRRNLVMVKPVLKELAAAPSVQTLFTYLTREIDTVLREGTAAPEGRTRLSRLMFMLDKLGSGFRAFGKGGTGSLSLEEFLFAGSGGESSFVKAGRTQILTLLPVKSTESFVPAEEALKLTRQVVASLLQRPEFKGIRVGLTGTPVLEAEEMATSKRDIALATAVSLVLTIILLLLAFRGVVNVAAAVITLLVAICISFGFATLAVGHLNILSMVFAIMLIGIGIEYGIQVVLRYREELLRGSPHLDAVGTGLNRNIWPIVMAAATVAAAFLTFVATDFRGIAELGIIAGGGVVICVLSTFTVLPALLVLFAPYRKPLRGAPRISGPLRLKAERLLFGHPKVVIVVAVLCTIGSLYPLSRIRFDYNLMNLQAEGLESVTYAYKLMRSAENAGYFAVATAGSEAEAAAMTARLEKLPPVDHVVSINSFVPEEQKQKLAEVTAMGRELADVRPAPYEEDLRLMELPEVFEKFHAAVVKLNESLARATSPEAVPVAAFLRTLDIFFAGLEKEKDRNAVGLLKEFQGGMLAELPLKLNVLKKSLTPSPVTTADVPAELASRFVGKTGRYLLQVAPRGDIFDREPLERFIAAVRSVDPHVTGEPVMVYESMTIMRDAYIKAFLYALVAIVVILLVTFRSLTFTVVGLVPLLVGMLFMVSGMWLCRIHFNSANIIVMPLILGIAVDSAIYIINRFRREQESAPHVVTGSTGVGVILNTLTIMASFGALMVAHHQGVFSIGAVMSLGMLACQIAFIIILPAVLTLVGTGRGDHERGA